ncbi:hypothetical protein IHO13_01390 [Wolbachia endosymbiont of Mansonella perstans]|nr:hypothetical protein [Wolbachia endosymbiont of Mansonella perstans]
MASSWCYIPTTIFALDACFFVKNAVQAAFFAKTKEPSPEFAEIITEPRTILKKSIVHQFNLQLY